MNHSLDKISEKPRHGKKKLVIKKKLEGEDKKDLFVLSDYLKKQILNRERHERKSQRSIDTKKGASSVLQLTSTVKDSLRVNNALIERVSK